MEKLKNLNSLLVSIIVFLLIGVGIFVNFSHHFSAVAADNIDAIAIRIIPNPNHLGINEWYASQGFSGSPQALLVDGYEAVRDNRTVYVAATNINENTNPDQLYFNIYIITYNQDAGEKTVDVFGKILSNWRFNNNLNETIPGTCSLPKIKCVVDEDCGDDGDCIDGGDYCLSKNNCRLDTDCPAGTFCLSEKAKLQRDIKRFNSLNSIKAALADYRSLHQRYPTLLSGTYLPSVAVSTWPSWQSNFLLPLNLQATVDPINKLGLCTEDVNATSSDSGYENQSCFNPSLKKFYKNGNSSALELPSNSSAIVYTSDPNGSNYNLCAAMETNYQIMSFVGGAPLTFSANSCAITAPVGYSGSQNSPAQIVAVNLSGQSGQEFNGYVQASDPEGNPITFTLDTSQDDWSSWSDVPKLLATNDPNQRKIWAATAGIADTYTIGISVKDSQLQGNSTTTTITIAGGAPTINAGDAEYDLSTLTGNQLDYSIYFTDSNFSNLQLSFGTSLAVERSRQLFSWLKTKVAQAAPQGLQGQLLQLPQLPQLPQIPTPLPPANCNSGIGFNPWTISKHKVNCTINLHNGLKGTLTKEAVNSYRFRIFGTMSGLNLAGDTNFNYQVKVNSGSGLSATKDFKILVKRNLPKLDYGCSRVADLYENYNCQINNLNLSNASTTYTFSGLPQGLTGSTQGVISGKPLSAGTYQVQIQAQNEYNYSATSSFDLRVENACGRNLVYYQGGPWDSTGEIRNQGGYYRTILIGDQCFLADNLNVGAKTLSVGACTDGAFNLEDFDNNLPNIPDIFINGNLNLQGGLQQNGLNVQPGLGEPLNENEIVLPPVLPDDNDDQIDDQQNGAYINSKKVSFWTKIKNFFLINIAQAFNFSFSPIGECYGGNNDPIYCEADGRLYSLADATFNPPCVDQTEGMRGPCPPGWHVPTDNEWHKLESAQSDPPLTETPGFCSSTRANAWDCTNAGSKFKPFGGSGFDALMSGRKDNTAFQERTNSTYYWSSSKVGAQPVYYKLTNLGTTTAAVYRGLFTAPQSAQQLLSVRCVKDTPCMADCPSGQYCNTLGQCDTYTP